MVPRWGKWGFLPGILSIFQDFLSYDQLTEGARSNIIGTIYYLQ